ncbi:hypothetical protein BDN72DRAFT_833223 [Pluteus cervinus]|uniref:Uncharacterized protein n=1 Tax=Pluteus cervinus TaxID=181527 RepID=A0ACD3BCG9_9AGAR|nr:hypothetical protein BDN72DRAFT_833223 [Pluteus cervinus]
MSTQHNNRNSGAGAQWFFLGPNPLSSSSMATNRNDPLYYIDLITFQVEDCLFRVPRSQFEKESEYFQELFTVPAPNNKPDGLSDEQPLVLKGVESDSFRQLLRVLYPRDFKVKEILTVGQWACVLALSDMYRFPRVRALAIQQLDKMIKKDPTRRLVLARQFEIDPWVLPALKSLVCREESLTAEEGHRLGMDTVIKIANFRERCYLSSDRYDYKWDLKKVRGEATLDLTEELSKEFGIA